MWLQKRFYGLCESYDVGIVANQLYLAFGKADNLDDIDGAYLGGVFVQFVQIGDDLLLVGNGHIQSTEVRVFLYNFHEILDTWNFEVYIFCINVFCREFLIEISDGKGMFQRVTY